MDEGRRQPTSSAVTADVLPTRQLADDKPREPITTRQQTTSSVASLMEAERHAAGGGRDVSADGVGDEVLFTIVVLLRPAFTDVFYRHVLFDDAPFVQRDTDCFVVSLKCLQSVVGDDLLHSLGGLRAACLDDETSATIFLPAFVSMGKQRTMEEWLYRGANTVAKVCSAPPLFPATLLPPSHSIVL